MDVILLLNFLLPPKQLLLLFLAGLDRLKDLLLLFLAGPDRLKDLLAARVGLDLGVELGRPQLAILGLPHGTLAIEPAQRTQALERLLSRVALQREGKAGLVVG